jgi:uncharacterized protein (DUF2062 family)
VTNSKVFHIFNYFVEQISGQLRIPGFMRTSVKRQILKSRNIREHRVLGYFGEAFDRRKLWNVTRYSVAKAFAVGIFSAYLPVPFEMIIAAVLAFVVRANLPISVMLIWVSNPFTWALLWGPPYLLGAALLGEADVPVAMLTRSWIQDHYGALFLGCVIVGVAMAAAAYFTVLLLWRMDVVKQWEKRRDKRKLREKASAGIEQGSVRAEHSTIE